ncbi:carbonic anhydraes family protein [Cylindrobasidium torrendii FP15055 ss-10]|uniref:Carbonic anhydrase n=1 Tax=Cylindrobasidium torrendii FP15055 ss-10 TaxID=1314674 RepID=A0A0D7BK51_9AGAR|nr:carbonic anhydraes family protein [Cylindrobasidium torrendii FP15055 ss-10]
MTSTFLLNNAKYAANFDQGALALPPSKGAIVLCCMDARVDPLGIFGLDIGEAHVIRNAGGRAIDAIRSIVISQGFGTSEIAVVHHTDCGGFTFTSDEISHKIKHGAHDEPAVVHAVDSIGDWGTQKGVSLENSVAVDVELLRNHPLVLKNTKVTGWVYDVRTGRVAQTVRDDGYSHLNEDAHL